MQPPTENTSFNKRKRKSPELGSVQRGQERGDTDPQPHPKKQDCKEADANKSEDAFQHADMPSTRLPSSTKFLPIILVGPHWHARGSLQNLVVFGDSYSKSNEGTTWVDVARRRLRSDALTVFNFAFPGATAETDFPKQLSHFLGKTDGKVDQPRRASLVPGEATYGLLLLFLESGFATNLQAQVIFLGINDCGAMGSEDLESIVESIFDALRRLYLKCNARNFILFDVPPTDRSPQAVDCDLSAVLEDNIKTWNDALRDQAIEFGSSNKDATVFLFSAHRVLTDVLDDPLEYDFGEDDPDIEGGRIWEDGLHLTSDIHDIFCKQLLTSILADQL